MDLQVIDNFLGDYQFKQLESTFLGNDFPWYYNDDVVREQESSNNYQFTHIFYDPKLGVISDAYEMMQGCLDKLKVKKLMRIKANLRPRTLFHRSGCYHIDTENVTTAILYLNTNNGWTRFKKGGKVKSVANRLVKFDSNLEHQGVTCTDEKRRVVINFNYE